MPKSSITKRRDLRTGTPLWLDGSSPLIRCSRAPGKQRFDTVIVGAGISGAALAYRLRRKGKKLLVVDRRPPLHGSTAASTALLAVRDRHAALRAFQADRPRQGRARLAAFAEGGRRPSPHRPARDDRMRLARCEDRSISPATPTAIARCRRRSRRASAPAFRATYLTRGRASGSVRHRSHRRDPQRRLGAGQSDAACGGASSPRHEGRRIASARRSPSRRSRPTTTA